MISKDACLKCSNWGRGISIIKMSVHLVHLILSNSMELWNYFTQKLVSKKKKKRKEHSLEKKEQLHLKIFRENDSDFDLVIDEKVESWIDWKIGLKGRTQLGKWKNFTWNYFVKTIQYLIFRTELMKNLVWRKELVSIFKSST